VTVASSDETNNHDDTSKEEMDEEKKKERASVVRTAAEWRDKSTRARRLPGRFRDSVMTYANSDAKASADASEASGVDATTAEDNFTINTIHKRRKQTATGKRGAAFPDSKDGYQYYVEWNSYPSPTDYTWEPMQNLPAEWVAALNVTRIKMI
jgi:hypothetical protein